jgi:hypothetical protein
VSIRDSLAAYDESVTSFEESLDENGDAPNKAYEYRDDSAVEFATAAADWIRTALETLPPEWVEVVDQHVKELPQPGAPTEGESA